MRKQYKNQFHRFIRLNKKTENRSIVHTVCFLKGFCFRIKNHQSLGFFEQNFVLNRCVRGFPVPRPDVPYQYPTGRI
jgi:hypothetical protein